MYCERLQTMYKKNDTSLLYNKTIIYNYLRNKNVSTLEQNKLSLSLSCTASVHATEPKKYTIGRQPNMTQRVDTNPNRIYRKKVTW